MSDIKSLGNDLRKQLLASQQKKIDTEEIVEKTEEIKNELDKPPPIPQPLQKVLKEEKKEKHDFRPKTRNLEEELRSIKEFQSSGTKRIETKITPTQFLLLSHLKGLYGIDSNQLLSYLIQDFLSNPEIKNQIQNSLNNLEL